MGTKRPISALLGWIGLVAIAAVVGAIASRDAPAFYGALSRPSWAPPAKVFGPVWTILYLLMAVAAWRVWREGGFAASRLALSLFIVQLAFNAAWSWLFFSLHQGLWALLDIALLWATVAIVATLFARRDRAAALMLLPYLAWVSYAAALNFAVWQRNPALLS